MAEARLHPRGIADPCHNPSGPPEDEYEYYLRVVEEIIEEAEDPSEGYSRVTRFGRGSEEGLKERGDSKATSHVVSRRITRPHIARPTAAPQASDRAPFPLVRGF